MVEVVEKRDTDSAFAFSLRMATSLDTSENGKLLVDEMVCLLYKEPVSAAGGFIGALNSATAIALRCSRSS